MDSFKISIGGKEYDVNSNTSNGKGEQNWIVSVTYGNVRIQITIPQENKVTRAKVLLFIDALHEGMKIAFEKQDIGTNYTLNQGKSIR